MFGKAGLLADTITSLGSAVGLYAVRTAGAPPPELYGDEDFGAILQLPKRIVTADDGVPLAVRCIGPADAELTVVLAHGFCLRMQSWHLQVEHLKRRWGNRLRIVLYDQRGHGESGRPSAKSCTIAQLGRDLGRVIDETTSGPVVVIGHSMGGMGTIASAGQRPDLFTPHGDGSAQVVGVGLLSTTVSGLSKSGIGRNLENPAIDAFRAAARAAPGVVQGLRGAAKAVISPILRAASYGNVVSPRLVEFSNGMLDATSVLTIVNFLPTLELHDETLSLAVLGTVPVLVLSGDADLVIPFESSARLAAELPQARLVRVRGAGHLVLLEYPEVTNRATDDLIETVFAGLADDDREASLG